MRRPRLRVVSHGLTGSPRNLAFFITSADGIRDDPGKVVVEVITHEQWDSMHPAERPEDAAFMPGVGYVAHVRAFGEDLERLEDAWHSARDSWKAEQELRRSFGKKGGDR